MKPNDFYLGISEIFSIAVPGFLVTVACIFLFADNLVAQTIDTFSWAVLAVASYVAGQILFAVGAWWDKLYDRHKPMGNEQLLRKIGNIRAEYMDKDCPSINKYQWCRTVLSIANADGYLEVLRKEADSKLFRSLIIPLLVISIYWFISQDVAAGIVSIVLSGLAYWRYRAQRFKACKMAYTQVITLFALGKV